MQIQKHDCEAMLVSLCMEGEEQKVGEEQVRDSFLQWIEHLKHVRRPTNVC